MGLEDSIADEEFDREPVMPVVGVLSMDATDLSVIWVRFLRVLELLSVGKVAECVLSLEGLVGLDARIVVVDLEETCWTLLDFPRLVESMSTAIRVTVITTVLVTDSTLAVDVDAVGKITNVP